MSNTSDDRSLIPPVLQIVGYKNSGKTTLITQLLRLCTEELDMEIGTIKHDQHTFNIDHEGTDSWQHRQAGAQATLISSPNGVGLTMAQKEERSLTSYISWLSHWQPHDLILVEGFKHEHFPKIVLIRNEQDFDLIRHVSRIELIIFSQQKDLQLFLEHDDQEADKPLLHSPNCSFVSRATFQKEESVIWLQKWLKKDNA